MIQSSKEIFRYEWDNQVIKDPGLGDGLSIKVLKSLTILTRDEWRVVEINTAQRIDGAIFGNS